MLSEKLFLFFLVLFCAAPPAQQPPCTADIPVNIVLPDGSLIRQLNKDGFVAQSKRQPLRVQSLTVDRNPRRIVFVVETGKGVPEAARKIETTMISEILTKARPEDSFALLTVRGPRLEVPFGASRDSFQTALSEVGKPPQGGSHGEGVLDAVLEAVGWFQQPQPGDAIVLLTMKIESPHRASYAQVREALAREGVRLFGVQLGRFIAGYYQSQLVPGPTGGLVPSASIYPNRENFFALSMDSGGFVFVENVEGHPQQRYKFTDARLDTVRYFGRQLYKAVTEYYSIRLEIPTGDFDLELADHIRQKFPRAKVLFPWNSPDCSTGKNSKTTH